MKYILTVLIMVGLITQCQIGKSTAQVVDPIDAAMAQLAKDVALYKTTAGSLAVAQATVAQLTPTAGSLAAAVKADQAALAALVNQNPGPGPTPVVTHTLSVLMIGGTNCGPCNLARPVVVSLAASGVPIREVPAESTEGQAWNVAATPTFIVTVDGKEVLPASGKRPVGYVKIGPVTPGSNALDEASLRAWCASIQSWFKTEYPNK
jgi:hypothetical protein